MLIRTHPMVCADDQPRPEVGRPEFRSPTLDRRLSAPEPLSTSRWHDADGCLSLLGRVDDVIALLSGRKVHPQLMEKQLRTVAWVADCGVFADERQQLRAVIVPAQGKLVRHELAGLAGDGAS